MNFIRKHSKKLILLVIAICLFASPSSAVFSKDNDTQNCSNKSVVAGDAATDFDNNGQNLEDGTYKVSSFGWSGGSGRLSYIKCRGLKIKDGVAYGTLEFGSDNYDTLKVRGKSYKKEGNGNSTFTIPVNINKNTSITGRTTAMSQAHWIDYNIYVGLEIKDSKLGQKTNVSNKKLNSKAPEIMGLEYKSKVEINKAKLFKIFQYKGDISLVQVDISSKSVLNYDDSKDESLYHHNVVNYLIVPSGVEVPAGLDKQLIVITSPVSKIKKLKDSNIDDYKSLVSDGVKLIKLDNKIIKGFLFFKFDKDTDTETLEESAEALNIPILFDRSGAESSGGSKEWSKVYKLLGK